jgi:hypothetical protein
MVQILNASQGEIPGMVKGFSDHKVWITAHVCKSGLRASQHV